MRGVECDGERFSEFLMQTNKRAPLVVSTETAGLGNRIKSWVSAMRLGNEAKVCWAVTHNMPAAFTDLFDNPCSVDEVPPDASVYCSWRLAVLPEDEAFIPEGFATAGGGAHPLIRGVGRAWWALTGRRSDRYRYMPFPKSYSGRSSRRDARHIDFEYGRIPERVRQAWLPFFARIEVRPELVQRAEQWASQHLDDDVIGVQIRTWRDDERRKRKYHLPGVRRLAKLLDGAPATSRFLVVSDSDDAIAELTASRGASRVLHFPRTTARRDSWRTPDGIREDLIDMLVLARTRTMFASYSSTFSEAAWWLGGATASVSVY
jgi:hypothetical protein